MLDLISFVIKSLLTREAFTAHTYIYGLHDAMLIF